MKNIILKIKKLCKMQDLIQEGDKIAVGLSGGKDSLVLLKSLCELRKKFKNCFSLIAICIDLSNGKMDFSKISAFCQKLDVKFVLVNSNIFEVVFDIRKEKNPCSLCANLRKGLLFSTAKNEGCNKVALGHHADDLLETFCMATKQENRLYVLPAKCHLSRVDLTLIRPMLLCYENEISMQASLMPVTKNICPVDHFTTRQTAKMFLEKLEDDYPNIKQSLLNALTNPQRYNLWEKKEN